jgi:hypothetical protein
MKKRVKTSKPAKKAARKAVKKPVSKPAGARQPTKVAPVSEPRVSEAARYSPAPLRADGWAPFRYPPQ